MAMKVVLVDCLFYRGFLVTDGDTPRRHRTRLTRHNQDEERRYFLRCVRELLRVIGWQVGTPGSSGENVMKRTIGEDVGALAGGGEPSGGALTGHCWRQRRRSRWGCREA